MPPRSQEPRPRNNSRRKERRKAEGMYPKIAAVVNVRLMTIRGVETASSGWDGARLSPCLLLDRREWPETDSVVGCDRELAGPIRTTLDDFDDSTIVDRSRRKDWNPFKGRLTLARLDGGVPEELPLPRGGWCSFSPESVLGSALRSFHMSVINWRWQDCRVRASRSCSRCCRPVPLS